MIYVLTLSLMFFPLTQMGEGEWAHLSEKERQLRLMKLKLEERRLRQEGKMDEAAALLGDALKSQNALEALMGESKKAQEEKLRLRLEKRKQRLAEGKTYIHMMLVGVCQSKRHYRINLL